MFTDSSKFCQVLSTRLDNVQLIRRDWNVEDAKVSNLKISLLSFLLLLH